MTDAAASLERLAAALELAAVSVIALPLLRNRPFRAHRRARRRGRVRV